VGKSSKSVVGGLRFDVIPEEKQDQGGKPRYERKPGVQGGLSADPRRSSGKFTRKPQDWRTGRKGPLNFEEADAFTCSRALSQHNVGNRKGNVRKGVLS